MRPSSPSAASHFLYAAAITHELHWPRDAARHMNNGVRRVATVKHNMPALLTNYSGRATYKKWDGATSTSAASHFLYGAALHAKLHQPDPDPGIRNPGGRDPFPGIRILGRGPMGGGPGRSPWPGAGLNGPELRAEPRARAPGSHARASGSLF